MAKKSFDLNIEKILENWEVRHGIREVIANALDEQILTGTAPVVIEKRDGTWIIRDEGRGIRYTHLTQNGVVAQMPVAAEVGSGDERDELGSG